MLQIPTNLSVRVWLHKDNVHKVFRRLSTTPKQYEAVITNLKYKEYAIILSREKTSSQPEVAVKMKNQNEQRGIYNYNQ